MSGSSLTVYPNVLEILSIHVLYFVKNLVQKPKNTTFYIFVLIYLLCKACNNYGLTVLHHLTTLYLAGFPLSSFSVIFQILFLILFFMSMSSYIMITAIYSQKNVLEIKVGLRPFAIRKKRLFAKKRGQMKI